MRILVGIPSYRRPAGLRRLLASLDSLRGLDRVQVEVFVADNDAGTREAAAVCAELEQTLRWPLSCGIVAERGISAARNAIVDEARARRADFIAMIDDDEVAAPDWLSELLRTRNRYDADVVGGPLHFDFLDDPSTSVRKCGVFDTPSIKEGLVAMVSATNNVLLCCSSLEAAGWPRFDSAFGLTGGGDTEFFTRLRKQAFRFAWSPKAVARETVPTTRSCASWVLRRSYRIGNNNMRIAQMHGGRRGIAISLLKAMVLLGCAPVSAACLAVPSRRLWILARWSQSLGQMAAVAGRSYEEYRVSAGSLR